MFSFYKIAKEIGGKNGLCKNKENILFGRHALLQELFRPSTDFSVSCKEGLDFTIFYTNKCPYFSSSHTSARKHKI